MDFSGAPARRPAQPPEDPSRARRARFTALGSLGAFTAVLAAIVLTSTGGSGSHAPKRSAQRASGTPTRPASGTGAAGKPGAASVPILAYHVINTAPPSSAVSAALYVPASEFSAQMDALKTSGWHAVTLNQLQAYWTRGVSLGPGKPIVISFDNGYASHYTNALPVLKRLRWVGVENLQVNGLPPTDGGLTDAQVRGLISAGWELDSDGVSQPDLTTLNSTQLADEVATGRRTLQGRYGLSVNWFSYPSGNYDPTVMAAVRAGGFVGALTVVPGWASPQGDRFRLPRLQVVGGTSPATLLSDIASAQQDPSPPATFHNPGIA